SENTSETSARLAENSRSSSAKKAAKAYMAPKATNSARNAAATTRQPRKTDLIAFAMQSLHCSAAVHTDDPVMIAALRRHIPLPLATRHPGGGWRASACGAGSFLNLLEETAEQVLQIRDLVIQGVAAVEQVQPGVVAPAQPDRVLDRYHLVMPAVHDFQPRCPWLRLGFVAGHVHGRRQQEQSCWREGLTGDGGDVATHARSDQDQAVGRRG